LSSVMLSNISTCYENADKCSGECSKGSSPSSARKGGLNCDFLLTAETDATTETTGEARIEELTIERCRLDLEGAQVLGKVLRGKVNRDHSTTSALRSLKLSNLAFLDEQHDECEVLLPILEGIVEAGERRGCMESIEFRQIALPNSPILRRRFFSTLGKCVHLKSLRLVDCDIRTEDAPELAAAIASLSNTLQLLDLSRNDIHESGLAVLLRDGLKGHKRLERLILSHNPIGDNGAIHLSRFLSRTSNTQRTTGIKSLWLVDCDIWSPGCASLARALKDFDTATELVVDGEWENHLEEVVESLRTNVVLKRLWVISDDDLWGETGKFHLQQQFRDRIEYYLALNRSHRRLSVELDLPFQLWPTVLDEKKSSAQNRTGRNHDSDRNSNPDIWYHLLRQRPELVASQHSA